MGTCLPTPASFASQHPDWAPIPPVFGAWTGRNHPQTGVAAVVRAWGSQCRKVQPRTTLEAEPTTMTNQHPQESTRTYSDDIHLQRLSTITCTGFQNGTSFSNSGFLSLHRMNLPH